MQQKTILITGVSRGLGRAMAVDFARSGHRVVGCGRSAEALGTLSEEVGETLETTVLDVSTDAVDSWAADLATRLPPPDLLINNAASINRPTDLWQVPVDTFEDLMATNVTGVFRVIRAFLPAMIEAGRGVVVNFSSAWGRSTSPGVAPYCATKYAIEGLTSALAQELPDGLAAVAVSPGVVDTEMLREVWGEGAAAYPKPAEWVERAVPFLLGLNASNNGESLTI